MGFIGTLQKAYLKAPKRVLGFLREGFDFGGLNGFEGLGFKALGFSF